MKLTGLFMLVVVFSLASSSPVQTVTASIEMISIAEADLVADKPAQEAITKGFAEAAELDAKTVKIVKIGDTLIAAEGTAPVAPAPVDADAIKERRLDMGPVKSAFIATRASQEADCDYKKEKGIYLPQPVDCKLVIAFEIQAASSKIADAIVKTIQSATVATFTSKVIDSIMSVVGTYATGMPVIAKGPAAVVVDKDAPQEKEKEFSAASASVTSMTAVTSAVVAAVLMM